MPSLIGQRSHGDRQTYNSSDGSSVEHGNPKVSTIDDVRNWLHCVGFPQYVDLFAENEVNGEILRTLTSEELRDDLHVVNLRHRRDLLNAIQRLIDATVPGNVESLPEHGRILDHLSNVRTYHSWVRVGVQLLGFAVVTLRLTPKFRETAIVVASSAYFAAIGIVALLYGVLRYRAVIKMIECSGARTPKYFPDKVGVFAMLIMVLLGSAIALALIVVKKA